MLPFSSEVSFNPKQCLTAKYSNAWLVEKYCKIPSGLYAVPFP